MPSPHLISRCSWQTELEQASRAVELQDFISAWSNTVLVPELTTFFDQVCPSTQTWRVGRLQLDLGEIPFDSLALELPRRLRSSLREAFARLQLDMARTGTGLATVTTSAEDERAGEGAGDAAALHQIGAPHATQEILHWFLQHGSAPWWYRGTESIAELWDRQLIDAAEDCVGMIRQLGQHEAVRQRFVWQLGEARVRRLVHLLEPWQGKLVCTFADELFLVQTERHIATIATRSFRDTTWITILGYLLVDRGTLFNTRAFVRATLLRIAAQYHLTFAQLMEQLHGAVRALAPLGRISAPFLLAIEAIYLQDRIGEAVPPPPEPRDLWDAMQSLLRRTLARMQVDNEQLTLAEVFSALAGQDPQRMAQLLRSEGRVESVRHGIVRLLSERELALAVRVLAPQDQEFILAHAAHSTQALIRHGQGQAPKLVWHIVLTYLLAHTMASFQRRQLVNHTLERLCARFDIDMLVLLDLLIFSATLLHPSPHRFQLLEICRELKAARQKLADGENQVVPVASPYRRALAHYLLNGRDARAAGMPAQAMVRELLIHGSAAQLQALVAEVQGQRDADAALALRLLQLAGPGQLAALFELLQPDSSALCLALMATWQRWQQAAALPSLARLDLALHLPGLMLQALPGFADAGRQGGPRRFDAVDFWHRLSLLLRKAGVDLHALAQQLHSCLHSYPLERAHLVEAEGRAALRPVSAVMAGAAGGELTRLWQRWLATMSAQPDPVANGQATARLAELLAAGDASALLRWLDGEPRQDVTLRWLPELMRRREGAELSRCLYRDLPAPFHAPEYASDQLLQTWSALFRHGGYWHGTRTVLEQQLQSVFYNVLWDVRQHKQSPAEALARMLSNACLRLNIRLGDCLGSFAGQEPLLKNSPWHEAMSALRRAQTAQTFDSRAVRGIAAKPVRAPARSQQSAAPAPSAVVEAPFIQDYLARYLGDRRLLPIARHLLLHGRAPEALRQQGGLDLTRLLFDLCTRQAGQLHALLAPLQSAPGPLFRLQQIMPLAWLLEAMQAGAPRHAGTVRLIAQLHHCLEQTRLAGVTRQQLSSVLFVLVLRHWLAQDWSALDIGRLVAGLALQCVRQFGLPPASLRQAWAPLLAGRPAALQAALRQLDSEAEPRPVQQRRLATQVKSALDSHQARPTSAPMMINNAGLVILHSFFEPLFSRLDFMEKGRFRDEPAQRRAVHCLQFLVTGHQRTPEHFMMFNKVLCGLPVHAPLELDVALTEHEIRVCESMLHSVMKYWSAIGNSSLDGFRGNWLVRQGSLSEDGEHWQLTVEKRAYDILLRHAPFSYSMLRLQWMEKVVHVTWPT